MESRLNPNIDLYRLNWESVLENGTYKGYQIEELSNALADKDGSNLVYNSKLKTVSYGPFILNLNHIASNENSSGLSYFSHLLISKLSDGYLTSHQKQINHLAELIKEKLNLDKIIIGPNKSTVPLIDAIRSGDLKEIKKLIQEGVNVDIVDDDGLTPLFHLVLSNNFDSAIMRELLQAGVNVNFSDSHGRTSLLAATWKSGRSGDIRYLEMLIEAGAEVTSIGRAICLKDPLLLEELINLGLDVNQPIDSVGTTPLELALNMRDHELLVKLFKAKAILPLSVKNRLTNSPDLSSIQSLIKAGFDINEINTDEKTLLTGALYNPDVTPVDFQKLIDLGADVNKANIEGFTPLMIANIKLNPSLVEILLNAGADVNKANNKGLTPLHFAIIQENLAIVEILLKFGADVNKTDNEGSTPLRFAISQENLAIVEILLKFGADVNKANNKGLTPLHCAISQENLAIVEILLKFGADVNKTDNEASTPLRFAISQKNPAIVEILLKFGADVMKVDKRGYTILDTMKFSEKYSQYREFVNLIKSANAEIKARHKELKTRKSLAHKWHLSGSTTFVNTSLSSPSTTIKLEGANSLMWYKKMQKNLHQNPNLFKNQKTLENTLNVAYINYNNKEVLNRIQSGLPTFIQTGFSGHEVTLLCWGNQMVICNRGGASRRPLEIYHFDPTLLTHEIIGSIRSLEEEKDYKYLFFNVLPKTLKFTQSNLDKILEKAAPLPYQTVGNCSWISPVTGVFAYSLLSGVRGEKEGVLQNDTPNNLSETIKIQVSEYRYWLSFEMITSLEQMIRQVEKNDYEPDHALIQSALRKAYFIGFDPVLSDKLEILTNAYIATLSNAEALEFKTNLLHWKMTAQMELPLTEISKDTSTQ